MKSVKKFIAAAVALTCTLSCVTLGMSASAESTGDVVILFTNDVHNAFEADVQDGIIGYSALAAYKKQLEAEGNTVVLVDAGDALQGGVIGTLSNGMYITEIMNKVGYDFAVPGNHEFDFGMDNLFKAADKSDFQYISCNFGYIDGTDVFPGYIKETYGDISVAYVGISTPESIVKSTPTHFMNDKGEYIYEFYSGGNGRELYDEVQKTVDEAAADGADYIIAVGHTGVDPSSSPWTSEEIIANVSGIDAYIDGHSHTVLNSTCKDKDGREIPLASTGAFFANLGQLTIGADGTVKAELISSDRLTAEDADTLAFVNEIKGEFAELVDTVVAKSEVDLVVSDPETGERLVRSQETNLGDLCADAYLAASGGADIAILNGGGVRTFISKGDITYGDIINVHPFGNTICVAEVTGRQMLDALEHSAKMSGIGEDGGFLQVAGITYEIDTAVPSSVVLDENEIFVKVDGERRVKNVKVGGEPIDLEKTYLLASHNYFLKSLGSGYSMFKDSKIIRDDIMIDNQALISYIKDSLGGKIAADSIYADPYGTGRIKVVTARSDASCTEDGYIEYLRGSEKVKEDIKATGHSYGEWKITKEPTADEEGEKTAVCEICGDVKAEAIGKTEQGTVSPGGSEDAPEETTSASPTEPPVIDDPGTSEEPDDVNPGASSGDNESPDTGVAVAIAHAALAAVAFTAALVFRKKK